MTEAEALVILDEQFQGKEGFLLVQTDLETIGDDVTARVRGCLEPAKTE